MVELWFAYRGSRGADKPRWIADNRAVGKIKAAIIQEVADWKACSELASYNPASLYSS